MLKIEDGTCPLGGVVTCEVIVSVALLFPDNTSVPRPSLAKTEASEKSIDAVPTFFALKVIEINCPPLPVYPGLVMPPLNDTWPVVLEKFGSSTQREKMEELFETEMTWRRSVGN